MSKRINTADIIDILSEELSITKKLSDDFVKALVETIEEALLARDSVRINGLGTFRTRWNKERKSVDVNTGEDIVIDGYYRVVFMPEDSLKDLANEPYAHLEAYVLEEVQEEEPPLTQEEIDENSDPAIAPLIQLDEQAGEIKSLLSEINAIGASVEVEEDIKKGTSAELEETEEEELVEEEEESPDDKEVKGELSETIEEDNAEDDKQEDEGDDSEEADVDADDKTDEIDEELVESEDDSESDKVVKSKPRSKAWRYIYAFLMIAIIVLLISLLVDNDVFSSLKNFYEEKLAPKQKVNIEVLDELSEPSKDEAVTEIVEDAEGESEQEKQQVTEDKTDYDLSEVLTTERVKSGSRLAQISYRHYGVREFWVYIFEANRDKLDTPDDLAVGMELIIPKLDYSIGDVNNPQCIEKAKLLQDVYSKK